MLQALLAINKVLLPPSPVHLRGLPADLTPTTTNVDLLFKGKRCRVENDLNVVHGGPTVKRKTPFSPISDVYIPFPDLNPRRVHKFKTLLTAYKKKFASYVKNSFSFSYTHVN